MLLLLALQAAIQPVPQPTSLGANNYRIDEPIAMPARAPSFADEFAGARVDPRRWRFDTALNRRGWANNEKQYYGPAYARVANGRLRITARRLTARPADWGGQAYGSARLVSRRALGYGHYEIRARLPCGRGTWPAVWLLPDSGKWPDAGEIDIMEMVGWDASVVHGTVHSGAFNHIKGTQRGAQTRVPTACTAFHRYQLEWTPDTIRVGIDGRAFLKVRDDQPGGAAAWPFTRPYNLILNVAVGGDWGGQKGIDDAALPQAMTVDYVRYWARRR